jgi:tetratricopeptide (TPR) repeat protein
MEELARNIPAAELNNCAIAYWQAGYHQQSCDLFQIALTNLRDRWWQDRTSQELDCESLEKSNVMSWCLVSSSENISVAMAQDDCFLLSYDQAIVLDISTKYEDEVLLLVVVMFNMALLHHSKGLEWKDNGGMEQARRLYHLSLEILNDHSNSKGTSFFRLVLLNNIAHIDSFVQCKDAMMISLASMYNILLETTLNGDDYEEYEDYEIFSLNVMVGQTVIFAFAPAA